ncbi:MAG: MCE family protein [Burkholderiaceae bacterium]|nr:MCE family protein [Burkholderiaceae bacterium]
MEPETRYTFVGAIVLALAAAAVAGFAWLSSVGPASEYLFYTIRFERQALDGVQVGGDVTMRGIKVGRVEDYSLTPGNINLVEVTIRVDRDTPVSDNTVAVLARNFVTGIARIELVTSGVPGPPLVTVKEGERYPVIPEGRSELAQIADSASRLARTAETTLVYLNEVLSPENRATFDAALAGARQFVDNLNQRMAAIDATARSLREGAAALGESSRRITVALESAARNVDPLAKDAGKVLEETRAALAELRATLEQGRAVIASAGSAVRGGEETMRQADATLAEFSRLASTLEAETRSMGSKLGDTADVGLLELRATAQELRSAAAILARSLERLQDPRAALVGPGPDQLGPGEVKR